MSEYLGLFQERMLITYPISTYPSSGLKYCIPEKQGNHIDPLDLAGGLGGGEAFGFEWVPTACEEGMRWTPKLRGGQFILGQKRVWSTSNLEVAVAVAYK